MTRREFFRLSLAGAVAVAAGGLVSPTSAQELEAAESLVGLARADHLYLPGPVYAPAGIYPEGKHDWEVVAALVKNSAQAIGLESPWNLFRPVDRVAVMIDVAPPAIPIIFVEAVLDQLVQAGVQPDRLLLFAADERDLFNAGFSLRSQGPGVRCLGAESVGYRGGLSRIVLDRCDKIVNLACLRPHRQVGMTGTLFNCLNAVDAPRRFHLIQNPEEIGSVAHNRQMARRLVLHFLDCTHPFYQVPQDSEEKPRWEYRGMLCSRDPLAADAVGQQILEAKRAAVRGQPWPLEPRPDYLRQAAEKYQVGCADPEQIRLKTVGDQTNLLL